MLPTRSLDRSVFWKLKRGNGSGLSSGALDCSLQINVSRCSSWRPNCNSWSWIMPSWELVCNLCESLEGLSWPDSCQWHLSKLIWVLGYVCMNPCPWTAAAGHQTLCSLTVFSNLDITGTLHEALSLLPFKMKTKLNTHYICNTTLWLKPPLGPQRHIWLFINLKLSS